MWGHRWAPENWWSHFLLSPNLCCPFPAHHPEFKPLLIFLKLEDPCWFPHSSELPRIQRQFNLESIVWPACIGKASGTQLPSQSHLSPSVPNQNMLLRISWALRTYRAPYTQNLVKIMGWYYHTALCDLHEFIEMETCWSLPVGPDVPRKATSYLCCQALLDTCLSVSVWNMGYWQLHLEIVALIFLTGVVGKIQVRMCCLHQG